MNPLLFLSRSLICAVLASSAILIASAHDAAHDMTEAGERFLAALTPEQRAKAVYEMKSDERLNWDFVPKARAGLTFKEMSSAQRQLAHALLSSGLSHRGYAKAVTIMSLDQILHELENQAPRRDPELYYVTIFGTPSTKEPWGWRVEGHHLSVNFTVAGDETAAHSPSFFGSNPAEVRQGPRNGLRVLGREEDLGYQLVRTLTDEQRRIAVFTNVAPRDIITGKAHQVSPLAPEGLACAVMNVEQQKLVRELVEEYARRMRPELADTDLKQIEAASWEKVCFAWAGSLESGRGHYYRVQGPTFLLEFDNTQDNANHIHTAWRDFKNDFGVDLLRRHHEQVPHAK